MRTVQILPIVLLLVLIIGCTRDRDEFKPLVSDKNAVTIQLSNRKADYKLEPIKMSEFVDSVKFIQLEETGESLIGSINKIFFTATYVIVEDRQQNTVFFFDQNGKYLKKISRKGRGPGEYLSLSSCMFDERKQQLIIYDILAKKILFYDLFGNFVKEIPEFSENVIIRDIINLPNGHFLCYTPDLVGKVDAKYTGLWEVDADGRFLRNYFTYNIILPVAFKFESNFQQLQNKTISLVDQIHNDIYHYHNGVVEKYISYNIKGNKLWGLKGIDLAKNERNIMAFKTQEKGDYIITLWADEANQMLFSLFSKKDKEVRYWDAYYTYDAAIPGVLFVPVDSNRPDMLVCKLNGNIIDRYLADPNLPESVRKALEPYSSPITGSANPVLELLYIKQSPSTSRELMMF
ncbi:MAG: 6-bladed beta-propeller [Bacteroidales bacterium]|nr:6-bladed beta-propeller [Bacteroidales bacterium]